METNTKKLAVVGIVLALFALNASGAQIYNFIAGSNIIINQSGNDITISADINVSVNDKINKTSDIVSHGFVLRTDDFSSGMVLNGTHSIYSQEGDDSGHVIVSPHNVTVRMVYGAFPPTSVDYSFNTTGLDLQGKDLYNCGNCEASTPTSSFDDIKMNSISLNNTSLAGIRLNSSLVVPTNKYITLCLSDECTGWIEIYNNQWKSHFNDVGEFTGCYGEETWNLIGMTCYNINSSEETYHSQNKNSFEWYTDNWNNYFKMQNTFYASTAIESDVGFIDNSKSDGIAQWSNNELISVPIAPSNISGNKTIVAVNDYAGSSIQAGSYFDVPVNFNGTINGFELHGDAVDTITVNIYRCTYETYPCYNNTVTGTNNPMLNSERKNRSNLVGWNVTVKKGDILVFNSTASTLATKLSTYLSIAEVN